MEIRFLSLEAVVALQDHQIKKYGGDSGIRDENLLESAVAMPKAGFGEEYLHKSFAEMAAAYLFHIVKNHPFIDGNKRAGASAAMAFLRANGFKVNATEDEMTAFVLRIASSEQSKTDATYFFKERMEKLVTEQA